MNSPELEKLYDEWRQVTHAEARAITAGTWDEVLAQQSRKVDLKRRIVDTTELWQKQWHRTGETASDYERTVRPLVDEMISGEMANLSLLAKRRTELEQDLTASNRAASNLRSLHRAYGSDSTAHWSSYS